MMPALLASAMAGSVAAPLSWSSYEYQYRVDGMIPESVWSANIDWVEKNLKPYGYRMIAIDGWGDEVYDAHGYRTSHSSQWKHDYAWWARNLRSRGMELGMYNNPLWLIARATEEGRLVEGTQLPLSGLRDGNKVGVFNWVDVQKPGAEAYVRGYVRHYAAMGIRYLRVDFLSWFENGRDRYMNEPVGRTDRPRRDYETALRWMFEECESHGMVLSLVMPHLFEEGILERRFGHMIRINEDASEGGWEKWSGARRGVRLPGWSPYANAVDGLIYWSQYARPGRFFVDPDFIRLNSFGTDDERRSVIGLCVMAGAPIAVADQLTTIGHSLQFYQNRPLMELHRSGFMGRPLSHDPTNPLSLIWAGTAANGDRVVGLFNREDVASAVKLDLAKVGVPKEWHARDLWEHRGLGVLRELTVSLPARGCRLLRFSPKEFNQTDGPTFSVANGVHLNLIRVEIRAPQGAEIFFTTDGTAPGARSERYVAPIMVKDRARIRTVAKLPGQRISEDREVSLEVRAASKLPEGWSSSAVGDAGRFAASFSGGRWALTTRGKDIEGTGDSFGFIHQLVKGNFEIQVRVDSVSPTFDWAKAGLMARASLEPGSPNVLIGITAGKGIVLQNRKELGGTTAGQSVLRVLPPYWLRLQRTGDEVIASISPNGQKWQEAGRHTLPGPLQVGLAHSSHQPQAYGTVHLSHFNLEGGV